METGTKRAVWITLSKGHWGSIKALSGVSHGLCHSSLLACLQLSFGGMPYSGKPITGDRKNFKGCVESVNYNGENITDLARRKKLDVSSFVSLTSLFFLLLLFLAIVVSPSSPSSSLFFLFFEKCTRYRPKINLLSTPTKQCYFIDLVRSRFN